MAERIVGIDFGTSTSVIRVRRYEHGMPIDMIPNAVTFNNSAPMVPTLIQKQEDVKSTYYGYDAETPKKKATVYQNFKLDLESSDPAVREKAKELTAEYLKECLGKAYRHQSENGFLGESNDNVTTRISYPVKWSEETRTYMVQAVKNAGFPNVEGLDEAQACIQAVTEQFSDMFRDKGYFQNGRACTTLLIDMGAGTTDLVLCRYTPGNDSKPEILSTWPRNGEALFGGHMIDDMLYSYITESFPTVQAVRRLPLSTFKAWKEAVVSPALQRNESVDYLAALEPIEMACGDELIFDAINREKFESLTAEYMKILPDMINKILNVAHMSGADIDLVILTGGHSQWYFVREILLGKMSQFGIVNLDRIRMEPERIVSLARPQETVALGLVYKSVPSMAPKLNPVEPKESKRFPEKLLYVERAEPDCIHQGNLEYWVRNSDKQIFLDAEGTKPVQYNEIKLQSIGHKFEWVTMGNKRIKICSRCGTNDGEEPVETVEKDLTVNDSAAFETSEADDEPTPEEEFQLGNIGNDYGIVKYLGKRSRVIIPETIRGRKVVQIGAGAFSAPNRLFPNHTLTYVEIPKTIWTIGQRAFFNCRELKVVKAHDGILFIGPFAFCGCNNLDHLYFGEDKDAPDRVVFFPKKLKEMGHNAFSSADNAFARCNLREVTFSKKTKVKNNIMYPISFAGCAVFYYEDQE